MSALAKFRPNDYRHVIVTTMKDECPYMLDWISYHLALGFTHIVIMTNDCSDGTEKLAKQFEKIGLVSHAKNKPPYRKGIQKTGFQRMRRFDAVREAKWLMALDVDEYLRIALPEDIKGAAGGRSQLECLLDFIGEEVYALSWVWQMFGCNNVREIIDAPVIAQFTRSCHEYQAQPYQIRGLKTIYRGDCFERLGTHRPLLPLHDVIGERHWIDADGLPIDYMRDGKEWCAWNHGLAYGVFLGRVHHYAIRSREALFLKLMRGFVNQQKGIRAHDAARHYWNAFEWGEVENTRILPNLAAAEAVKSELSGVGNIQKLHEDGVRHHQGAVKEALADPERAALYRQVMDEFPIGDPHPQDDPTLFFSSMPRLFDPAKLPGELSDSLIDARYLADHPRARRGVD